MPIYDCVDGVARKVTKMYDGVDGVARNVAKVYSGVDNVARLCYTSGVKWYKYPCTLEERYRRVNCNLFDASKLLTECGWVEENGYLVGTAQSAHEKFGPKTDGIMSLEGIDTVSMSFRGYIPVEGKTGLYFAIVYDDGYVESLGGLKTTTEVFSTRSSDSNRKPKKLCLTYSNYNGICYIKDIQLEIGTTTTPYVPYQSETAWQNCVWDSEKEQAYIYLETGYSFSSKYGFTIPLQYKELFYFDKDVTLEDLQSLLVGYCNVDKTKVRKIVEVKNLSWQNDGTLLKILFVYEIREKTESYQVFVPEEEPIEELIVPENEFPGEGTLVDGSYDGPYYILSPDLTQDDYYYYTKEKL